MDVTIMHVYTIMNFEKLSLSDNNWWASNECIQLTERAKTLLLKDELDPNDIEIINNFIQDEYREEFWDIIIEYFDKL